MSKLIIGIVILSAFLVQINVKSQYLNELKLKENKSVSIMMKKNYDYLPKKPVVSGLLSFIVPGFGFGQLYNEQPIKCLIHSAISIPCIILAVVSLPHTNIVEPGTGNGPFLISFSVFTVNWIWSIVDAVISANNINKQVKLQNYRSDAMNRIKFGLNVDKNKKLNLKFVFEL